MWMDLFVWDLVGSWRVNLVLMKKLLLKILTHPQRKVYEKAVIVTKKHHQTQEGRCKPIIENMDLWIKDCRKWSQPATFLVKLLSVGFCCPDLSDSDIQLAVFIGGGGRLCPMDCLRVPMDIFANFSALSETPRTLLPLFIPAAKHMIILMRISFK